MNYAKRFVAELGLELDDLLDVGQRIRQGKAYGEL